jgi:hypothetical protein
MSTKQRGAIPVALDEARSEGVGNRRKPRRTPATDAFDSPQPTALQEEIIAEGKRKGFNRAGE